MKDIYKALNEIDVDTTEYEAEEITYFEKKRLKKRLKKQIGSRKKFNKLKVGSVIAAMITMLIFGISNNVVTLANVPFIGPILEDYLRMNDDETLEDYKVGIGRTVEDGSVAITLNEVLIDEGQLLINSTFHSKEVNFAELGTSPTIYIDGEEIGLDGGGGSGDKRKIDDDTYIFFDAVDIPNLTLGKEITIKIEYKNLRISPSNANTMYGWDEDFETQASKDAVKIIKGNWSFQFQASAEALFTETNRIAIDKTFSLKSGQKIIVDEIVFTPISTTIHYQNLGGEEFDTHFILEDETGKTYNFHSGHTLAENSHIRFDVMDETVETLIITPYLISGMEGEEKTDYYKVLEDEKMIINVK